MNRILFLLLVISGLQGCSPERTQTEPKNALPNPIPYPNTTVGISMSSIATNPFFKNTYRIYGEVTKENSATLKTFINSADNDQVKQNTQLEEMVKQGARSLVVNLVDVTQGKEIVEYWCNKKIPVVYFNRSPGARNLANCATAYFVDGDMAQAAVYQGVQVLERWKENPSWDKNKDGVIQYAMIMGLPEHEGTISRTKWAISTLETYPKLNQKTEKVFQDFGLFQGAKSEALVNDWIERPEFSKVEVILANNDTMALGASVALEKHHIQLPIFGIDGSKDALEAVKQGKMAGTVFNDFDEQARVSLRMAANLATGKNPMEGLSQHLEYKTVLINAHDINNNNIQDFMQRYQ